MSILSKPYFHDEEAAFAHLEGSPVAERPCLPALRRRGPYHQDQGEPGEARPLSASTSAVDCKRQFTVKVGTVFEHGRIPLHKFLQAVHLMCCSARRASARTSSTGFWRSSTRRLGFSRTASAKPCAMATLSPFGGAGKVVEADETYYRPIGEHARRSSARAALQERKGGSGDQARRRRPGGAWRPCPHVPCRARGQGRPSPDRAREHRPRDAADDRRKPPLRDMVGEDFANHETVKHSRWRVRPLATPTRTRSKASSASSSAA